MARYAAFLRAVNLGRTRKASSADLKAIFEGAGFEDVATFRTSGNVVFDAAREPVGKMTSRIEKALERGLGFDATVFVRTAGELTAIAGHDPFPRARQSDGKLQVMVLGSKPKAGVQNELLDLATANDRLAFGPRELYWLPKHGVGGSKLNVSAVEKLIGPGTLRTKGTMIELVRKFFT